MLKRRLKNGVDNGREKKKQNTKHEVVAKDIVQSKLNLYSILLNMQSEFIFKYSFYNIGS